MIKGQNILIGILITTRGLWLLGFSVLFSIRKAVTVSASNATSDCKQSTYGAFLTFVYGLASLRARVDQAAGCFTKGSLQLRGTYRSSRYYLLRPASTTVASCKTCWSRSRCSFLQLSTYHGITKFLEVDEPDSVPRQSSFAPDSAENGKM